ncbi:MAG: tetratricopeptide repeat protein, partial [Omnitrophica WOR_2 bacterium]
LAIERDANLGEAYLARASFLLEHGQAEAALEDIRSAKELLPESPTIFIYRSQAELALKEYQAAYDDAQKAIEMDRTSLPGFLALGQAALEVGENGEAIQALKVYLDFNEQNAAAWLALGKAYYQTEGKALQAMQALDQALQLDKRLAEAYLYRGLLHLEDDEGQEAVNDFMSARRFDSRSFLVNLGLGRALFASNRLGEARGQLNSTLKLAETDAEQAQVYYWRAQVLEAYGIPQSAAADWEALLALPSEVVPREWNFTARRSLIAYYTPVPTFPPPTGGR